MKNIKFWLCITPPILVLIIGYFIINNHYNHKTIKPRKGEVIYAVYATGNVEPLYWSKVSPLMLGEVVEILAKEGQDVKKGEILAKLDDKIEKQKLYEIEAKVAFLAKEKERSYKLSKQKSISKSEFDKISYQFDEAISQYQAQKHKLEKNLNVRAPIDGTILRKEVKLGEIVDPSDNIFWVGKRSPLRIVAEVDEEDIPKIKHGQIAYVKSDAFANNVIKGKISSVTPFGDPINKNFRVYIELSKDNNLFMGMTVEVNIVIKKVKNALLIPAKTIKNEFAWVKKGRKIEKRKILKGAESNGDIHIIKGLSEDDEILLDPTKE